MTTRTAQFFKGERTVLPETGEGPFSLFLKDAVAFGDTPHGKGVKAIKDLPKGTVIFHSDLYEERTLVRTLNEWLEMPKPERDEWVEYAWYINGVLTGLKGSSIDEGKMEELTNCLNHSCDASIGFQGDHNLVTLRDIRAGEDLTVDYAMTEWTDLTWRDLDCDCGSEKCRKVITAHGYRLPQVQEQYKGHFLSSVQRCIDALNLPPSFFGTGANRELNSKIDLRPHQKFPGHGLFAREQIEEGEVVWRANGIEGVSLTLDEVDNASPERKEFLLHYGYQTGPNSWTCPPSREWLEAGNDSSFFLNHSCEPNVAILLEDVWVASRTILPDEELCYDYATSEVRFVRLPQCLCGSKLCRGEVGPDDWKRQDLRRRYGLAWASHVIEMLDQEDQWLQPGENYS